MKRDNLNRRNFNQLAAAALGGMVAGTMAGCGGGDDQKDGKPAGDGGGGAGNGKESDSQGTTSDAGKTSDVTEVAANDWMGDVHVCRGLNACQNKGGSGENACAGQGTCATATAHACHEMNDCKFQGGCGESVGTNACKGQGECAVPLGDTAWKAAREKFEGAMEAADKAFGEAPPKSS